MSRIQGMIDFIKSEKDNYVILMGDQVDAIAYNDPRYDGSNPYNPLEQLNQFVQMFMPIKDRILGILDGNHELKLRPIGLVTRDIVCAALGVPYGTTSSIFVLKDEEGNLMYRVFAHHGFSNINPTHPSKLVRETRIREALKAKLRSKCGDAVVMALGHIHKLLVYAPEQTLHMATEEMGPKARYISPQASLGGGFIHPDYRWYVGTGSFLRNYTVGYSGYNEIAGYDPVDLGYAVINTWDSYPKEVVTVTV
jgi:hypothetical protein